MAPVASAVWGAVRWDEQRVVRLYATCVYRVISGLWCCCPAVRARLGWEVQLLPDAWAAPDAATLCISKG